MRNPIFAVIFLGASAHAQCLSQTAPPRPMSALLAASICKSVKEDGRREARCQKGEWSQCDDAARARVAGCGVARDERKAMAMATRACDAGAFASCRYLAVMYEKGRVESDLAKAAKVNQRACDGGDEFSCTSLLGSGAKIDGAKVERSVQKLNQACDAKKPLACHELGVLYERALGVAKDEKRAASLYQRACDMHFSEGCKSLGLMYSYGKGVPTSRAHAKELYEVACVDEISAACDHLAVFAMEDGDSALSLTLAERACDLEDAHACANLGAFYMNGDGVTRDPKRAAELFERACREGETLGCRFLARTLKTTNPARSDACLKFACDRGDAKACAMK